LPKFEKIEAAVWRYFKTLPNFQTTFLITKSHVEPVLSGLASMGFDLPDPKSILDKLPTNNEFLVTELYSPAGRKFMTRIAGYPDAYDRLDRLSRLSNGKQTVHDLVYGAGGEKMIQYLTTAPGGKEMGKMLSKSPQGADFNDPTGRIYTVQMLIAQLKVQYQQLEKK
jgi:hypothetical protein